MYVTLADPKMALASRNRNVQTREELILEHAQTVLEFAVNVSRIFCVKTIHL